MADEIRIAIVEDQKQTREGLTALIGGTTGYRVVGSYRSMEDALAGLARLAREPAAIVLLDIGLPGMDGIAGVRRLRADHASLAILMLAIYADNARVFEAICAARRVTC